MTVTQERHTEPQDKTLSQTDCHTSCAERTSLVTRGRTPSGTRRWALRAASPARHPDAQGARANDRQHAKTDCNPADRPPGRGMMRAWSCFRYVVVGLGSSPLGLGACPSQRPFLKSILKK